MEDYVVWARGLAAFNPEILLWFCGHIGPDKNRSAKKKGDENEHRQADRKYRWTDQGSPA